MRIYKISSFIVVSVLIFTLSYQSLKKENVYIYFEDIKGYSHEYSNSKDTLKSTKIFIRQAGKLSYEYWELNVDTSKIEKVSPLELQSLLLNSQYIIINNFGGIGNKNHLLNKYRFHVICQKGNLYYILPVTNLNYAME